MSSLPNYEPGLHTIPPSRPLSPATSGIRLNHLMLRITDPVASLRFYNDCLGMHTIFIFNTGPWTIYYLGPRNISMSNMGTASGLLELYHIPGHLNQYKNGNENGGEGFGHLGFTVPDVEEVLGRVKEFGYRVIKPLGEDAVEGMGVPGFVKAEDVEDGYRHVFRQLAFVVDPDVSDIWGFF
jgi:lactoylglutathione lyase